MRPRFTQTYTVVAEALQFPAGRGCEPFWQHIARLRELPIVRRHLPPPHRA